VPIELLETFDVSVLLLKGVRCQSEDSNQAHGQIHTGVAAIVPGSATDSLEALSTQLNKQILFSLASAHSHKYLNYCDEERG
jgi:hypothetical protein